jgi:hypothetical protein
MEGTMSLSAWEQRNLDSIKDGLAGSDPGLAALLLGLLATISLITVGLVLSRGSGQGACPRSGAVICVDSATADTSHPAP